MQTLIADCVRFSIVLGTNVQREEVLQGTKEAMRMFIQ